MDLTIKRDAAVEKISEQIANGDVNLLHVASAVSVAAAGFGGNAKHISKFAECAPVVEKLSRGQVSEALNDFAQTSIGNDVVSAIAGSKFGEQLEKIPVS